jgi:valyl-tRNA synthetase
MSEFPSTYEPQGIEKKWSEYWEKEHLFTPKINTRKPPYTIMIPLPNITGRLTLGHTLNDSIQDIIIRYKKLTGFETLWLVGMDHAGIATQVVVEEKLREKGITKEDMGREKFIAEVWKWKEQYASIIRTQLRRMGLSLDWSREQFTLSDDYSKKVVKVFVDLYKKGLIYRGEYIINWCPRCQSALSDEQTETEEQAGALYYIQYPIVGTDEHLTVATTRPETMLGDTAVCVNPEDSRYQKYVGKQALLPIMDRRIPIIADPYVDPEFGTGALKVTPSHDPFDFELAKKHNLEFINIMNPDATLNENTGEFKGIDRYEARKKVLRRLEKLGLLKKKEKYRLPLSKCERCGTAIEPRVSTQWFVKMKPLAGPALDVVKNGEVSIYPKRWVNLYNHWLENVRDWCISRQLWWGHRIPVYYCGACFDPDDTTSQKGIIVSAQKPKRCPECKGTDIMQDEDVLDTWFSSWLWPFATLGWPKKTTDYKRFYPTQTLVTGWDIIYLWVARMIMAGIEFTGNVPFNNVVFHPMIRDEKGRKMSKSLGNSPDPSDLVKEYGADALRFGIQLITPKEQDVLFSKKAIDVGRKFCNKLWNASRFVLKTFEHQSNELPDELSQYDEWILSEFNKLLDNIEAHYEGFELNAIARDMYDFVWHQFCDWYLEIIKIAPSVNVARYMIKQIIVMLHPFIPFITEEIYHRFGFDHKSILLETWPDRVTITKDVSSVAKIKQLITEIRNVRGLFNISPKEKLDAVIKAHNESASVVHAHHTVLARLAGLKTVEINVPVTKPAATVVLPGLECYLILSGIDIEKEKERLENEIGFLTRRIDEIKYRLNNPQYVKQANKDIQQKEKDRLADFLMKKDSIQKAIEKL